MKLYCPCVDVSEVYSIMLMNGIFVVNIFVLGCPRYEAVLRMVNSFCMWSQLTIHMLTTNLQRPYNEIMTARQLFNYIGHQPTYQQSTLTTAPMNATYKSSSISKKDSKNLELSQALRLIYLIPQCKSDLFGFYYFQGGEINI